MNLTQKIIKPKLGLLELAKHLGLVAQITIKLQVFQ
jgi:hypothetical protein